MMGPLEQGVRNTIADLLYARSLLRKVFNSGNSSTKTDSAVDASLMLLKVAIKSQEKIADEFRNEER